MGGLCSTLGSVSPSSLDGDLGFFLKRTRAPNHGDLLSAIFKHNGDLKGSSVNRVLTIWPSHFQQFGSFVTKMSDEDRDIQLIADPKVVQARIDAQPRERKLSKPLLRRKSPSGSWVSDRSRRPTQRSLMSLLSRQWRASPQLSPLWRMLGLSWMSSIPAEPDHEVMKLHKCLRRPLEHLALPWIMPRQGHLPMLSFGTPA